MTPMTRSEALDFLAARLSEFPAPKTLRKEVLEVPGWTWVCGDGVVELVSLACGASARPSDEQPIDMLDWEERREELASRPTPEEDAAWREAEERIERHRVFPPKHFDCKLRCQDLVRGKYHREIKPGVFVDVYDVLRAWGVTNPALQHLIKKALQPGERGHKTLAQDMADIVASAKRAEELEK